MVAVLGPIVPLFIIGWLHDKSMWLWNPRRKWGAQHKELAKAKTAIADLVKFKDERRIEERQKWRNEFEKLMPKEPKRSTDGRIAQIGIEHAEKMADQSSKWKPVHPPTPTIFAADGTVISGPRITPAGRTPQPLPVTRTRTKATVINTELGRAEAVRMGKHIGCWVVHGQDWYDADYLLAEDRFTVLKIWDEGHDSACPGDCDCPKWARRF